MTPPTPVMLLILDGFGWREDGADNAVRQARTPNFDRLWAGCPHAFLEASGEAVGLPHGQFGNSEVGHTTIGAGRALMQDLPRISRAAAAGKLGALPAFGELAAALRQTGGACHMMGLVSPGGVHAHQDHALALARALREAGIRVAIHAFTDGRDTPPQSAEEYVRLFEVALPEGACLATLCGRYHAMDRDNRWERVRRAYDLIVHAEGARFPDARSALAAAYAAGVTDEFVEPAALGGYAGMREGDALLCFNFRSDRMRELLDALLDPGFEGFPRGDWRAPALAVGMTQYSKALAGRMRTLFPPQAPGEVLGEVVARAGKRQLRAAETEKYPHVTYFMNGGREAPFPGEERILVPSPKVATYDLQPEMSAPELTEKVVAAIGAGGLDLVVMNYANPDMVGHTGDLGAAIRAVEAVDEGLGRIAGAIEAAGGALLVTADHGNCETMRDEAGRPHTAHTTNKVPALLLGGPPGARLRDGGLADLAPTVLALMGVGAPVAMEGRSLVG